MSGNRLQGIPGFVGLLAICTALGYGAWKVLTRPIPRATQIRREAPANDSLAFFSVAGEGVDLEVVSPGGLRTSTTTTGAGTRIAGSDASVDCPGFADPHGNESECTASVRVATPSPGDYTIIARGAANRAITLNVGWATASGVKHGGFDVRVQVRPGAATAFAVLVARDVVSQRSEPRPLSAP